MELDPQRLFGLLQLYSLAERLRNSPPPLPRIWAHVQAEGAVSQDRRHLFVTPWVNPRKQPIGKKVAIKNFVTLTHETMKIKFRIK